MIAALHMALNFQWTWLFVGIIYYKHIRSSIVGDNLSAALNLGISTVYVYAVSVIRSGTDVVGHISRQISTPCNEGWCC